MALGPIQATERLALKRPVSEDYMASKTEKTLWGIHGGKTGDADNLFLARCKGLLPLKRVYVPEPLETTET